MNRLPYQAATYQRTSTSGKEKRSERPTWAAKCNRLPGVRSINDKNLHTTRPHRLQARWRCLNSYRLCSGNQSARLERKGQGGPLRPRRLSFWYGCEVRCLDERSARIEFPVRVLLMMRNCTLEEISSPPAASLRAEALVTQGRNFFPFPLLWLSIIALEISIIAVLSIAESDIWFHLRNAQQLLAGHSFLRADLYTFTTAGSPLLNFEWLSEIPYYLAFSAFGLRGMLAVYMVVLWLVFGGMYYLALRRGANCGDAALVTMAAAVLGSYSFGPRMLHFGWLCLVAELVILERFRQTGKGLWILPPVFALWINLHGSWVFGLVVLGLYVTSGLLEGHWGKVDAERWTPRQLRQLIVISVASVAAMLVNPYGYKLLWYPFDLLFRQQPVLGKIVEWQSVDFHSGYGKLAMLTIFALLATTLCSARAGNWRDVLLVAFAIWTALTHVRFLLFAAIVLIPCSLPGYRCSDE